MTERWLRRTALFVAAVALFAPACLFAAFPGQQPAFFAIQVWGVPVSAWMTLGLMIATVLLTALAAREARRGPRT